MLLIASALLQESVGDLLVKLRLPLRAALERPWISGSMG